MLTSLSSLRSGRAAVGAGPPSRLSRPAVAPVDVVGARAATDRVATGRPRSVSLPAPPSIESAPAPPSTTSLPASPRSRSLPARPEIVSFPPSPQMASRPAVPVRLSALIVPVIVQPERPRLGPQSGDMSQYCGLANSRRCEPPVAVIRKNSRLSLAVRSLTKTIERPSGEKDGRASSAGLFVSRRWPAPSAFIAQMSRLPGGVTIRVEDDRATVRRPARVLAADVRGVRELRLSGPVGVHHPHLPAAGAVTHERDAGAVGRPGRIGVVRRRSWSGGSRRCRPS